MTGAGALGALLERVEAAAEPDREIDREIEHIVCEVPRPRPGFQMAYPTRYTESLDAAVALVERRLPGFWQSSGLCALTGHASMGPDYNGPHGERLRGEWPEAQFDVGFHADLKPGDGRHRQCLALLSCLLQAEIARAG